MKAATVRDGRRARRETVGSVSELKSRWEEMSARCGIVMEKEVVTGLYC